MKQAAPTEPSSPATSLAALREEARACTRCPLHTLGTQTVFGAGPAKARLMLVGEQPGNEEDKSGLPFVGPAGKLLDSAIEEAGIDRSRAYVTNAVKHFKWVARGKRRLHAKPTMGEVRACKFWLESEIALLRPRMLICLGATAAQSLLGAKFRVTKRHGEFFATDYAKLTMATIHPSSVLRAPDATAREVAMAMLVADLSEAARRLKKAR